MDKPQHKYEATSDSSIKIGAMAPITLKQTTIHGLPHFTEAVLLPGRGMNTFGLKACLQKEPAREQDVISALSLTEAETFFAEADPYGNHSFKYGGAILIPFANRIRGAQKKNHSISARILGHDLELKANKAGKKPGAEPHAMHGLILKDQLSGLSLATDESGAHASACLEAGDFGVGWPSRMRLKFQFTLVENRFRVQIEAENMGDEASPIGIGWHPYFNFPSGQRSNIELKIPANRRALIDNYDNVFPTGETELVKDTPYDFRKLRPLGDIYLDDCFLEVCGPVELVDRAAGYGLRIHILSSAIKAIQIYAPTDKSFIAIEPQFNIADPYGSVWQANSDNGMVIMNPGDKTSYDVELELFTPNDME